MQVVAARPPLFDAIRARFGPAVEGAIFAWGDLIYNPTGNEIPVPLLIHEEIHCLRQRDVFGVEVWWRRYIDESEFRLDEEVLAHRAEYETILHIHGDNRRNRRWAMSNTAARLANPMYDYGITTERAKRLLREVAREHTVN